MNVRPLLLLLATANATMLSVAPARSAAIAGPPEGKGWYSYTDHNYRRGWPGPRYNKDAGPYQGWYSWNGSHYRRCSYRWTHHHLHREWRCW